MTYMKWVMIMMLSVVAAFSSQYSITTWLVSIFFQPWNLAALTAGMQPITNLVSMQPSWQNPSPQYNVHSIIAVSIPAIFMNIVFYTISAAILIHIWKRINKDMPLWKARTLFILSAGALYLFMIVIGAGLWWIDFPAGDGSYFRQNLSTSQNPKKIQANTANITDLKVAFYGFRDGSDYYRFQADEDYIEKFIGYWKMRKYTRSKPHHEFNFSESFLNGISSLWWRPGSLETTDYYFNRWGGEHYLMYDPNSKIAYYLQKTY